MAFIVNRRSNVPNFAHALQASGRAAVLFQGEGEPSTEGGAATLPLVNGWTVRLRVGEELTSGGTGLPLPTYRILDNADAIGEAMKSLGSALPPVEYPPAGLALPQPRPAEYPRKFPPLEERLLAAYEIWGTFQ